MARTIEDEITNCLRRTPISDGDNLLGFEIDLLAIIENRNLFVAPSVRRTGDPRCILMATCELAEPPVPANIVLNTLKEMWLEHLAYRHAEAHSVEVSPEQISLRFVTTTGDTSGDICVTGKIIVSGLQP
jgi:hypothetical protein